MKSDTVDGRIDAQSRPFGARYGLTCPYNLSCVENDEAWAAFGQINEWVRFADAKATALLATGGVLGGLLVSSAPSAGHSALSDLRLTFFVVAVCAVALSTLMSLQALLPRLGRAGQPSSLIFFDHVARGFANDADGFVSAFAGLVGDTAAMSRAIGAQIWANSILAHRKFRRVTYATWLIGVAMLCAGMTALLPPR